MTKLMDASRLREEAQRLHDAAAKLAEAADILDGNAPSANRVARSARGSARGTRRGKRGKKNNRLTQLQRFLKDQGPMVRKQIIEQSGIPVGSIGMILKPKNGFEKKPDGRWGLAGSD